MIFVRITIASVWLIPLQNENILLKNSVRFGHFQFYAGQVDGLNHIARNQKANKKFQPNLGSGQTAKIDLDFNRGKIPVIKSLRRS